MTPVLMAVSLIVGFGAGWLTKRHRLGLLAENNHWLAEDIEAVKGADLDADVAAERALRLSGEQPAVEEDPEPPKWMDQSGYRPPQLPSARCDFNGPWGDSGLCVPVDWFNVPVLEEGWPIQLSDAEGNRCRGHVVGFHLAADGEGSIAEIDLDQSTWEDGPDLQQWADAVHDGVEDEPGFSSEDVEIRRSGFHGYEGCPSGECRTPFHCSERGDCRRWPEVAGAEDEPYEGPRSLPGPKVSD